MDNWWRWCPACARRKAEDEFRCASCGTSTLPPYRAPAEAHDPQHAAPATAPAKPSRSSRRYKGGNLPGQVLGNAGWVVLRIVIGSAVLGGAAYGLGPVDDPGPIDEPAAELVGRCAVFHTKADGSQVLDEVVSCDQPHAGQVSSTVTDPASCPPPLIVFERRREHVWLCVNPRL